MQIDEFEKYVNEWKRLAAECVESEIKENIKYNQGLVKGLSKEGWQEKNDSELYARAKSCVEISKETRVKELQEVNRDAQKLIIDFLIARERSNVR